MESQGQNESVGISGIMGGRGEVVVVACGLWVLLSFCLIRDGEVFPHVLHFIGRYQENFLYLISDAKKKCVEKKASNEHDCVDCETIQVHCHGTG